MEPLGPSPLYPLRLPGAFEHEYTLNTRMQPSFYLLQVHPFVSIWSPLAGADGNGQGIGSRRRWEGSERIMSDDWSGRDCSSVVPTSDGSPLLPPSVVVCPVPIGRLFGGPRGRRVEAQRER